MEVVHDYWPAIVVAVVFLIILAFLIFRPRQRVSLTDSAPVRPHMQQAMPREGRGIAGEAAAATSDLAGNIISAPVHSALEGDIPRDDLCMLKGVGPKFADALHAAGFVNFQQIAGLTRSRSTVSTVSSAPSPAGSSATASSSRPTIWRATTWTDSSRGSGNFRRDARVDRTGAMSPDQNTVVRCM